MGMCLDLWSYLRSIVSYMIGQAPQICHAKAGICRRNADGIYGIPCKVIQILLIAYWLYFLQISDSYYIVYLVCGLFAAFSVVRNKLGRYGKASLIFVSIMSVLFSLGVLLANWHFLQRLNAQASGLFSELLLQLRYFCVFAAGFSISFNSIIFIAGTLSEHIWVRRRRTAKQAAVFAAVCMGVFCLTDISVLFAYVYPGTLTGDSLWQITQITENSYNNHHPFWHTMLVKGCLKIGMGLFHDINAAVALYSILQIFLLAACFTYALTTLYEIGIPAWAAALSLVLSAAMPYNIIYSYVMWKDILFGGLTLVFVVSIYRIIYGIGNEKLNIVSLFYGGLGMTLLRSNGFFAFLCSAIVFAILYRKKFIRVVYLFLAIMAAGYVMKYPVLKAMDVAQPNIVESISIPLQQFAKVIVDGKTITPEEKKLFSHIVDIPMIPRVYLNWLADPMKNLVKRQEKYLNEHKSEYLRAWLGIGARYPAQYLEAWVDQTKGFWHGGYSRIPCEMGINDNVLGIRTDYVGRTCLGVKYFRAFAIDKHWYNKALKLFLSIGFHFWLLVAFFCCNVINRRKTEMFMAVPALAVIVSLFMATPLYCEFRYAFALACCLPFVILCSVYCNAMGGSCQGEKIQLPVPGGMDSLCRKD